MKRRDLLRSAALTVALLALDPLARGRAAASKWTRQMPPLNGVVYWHTADVAIFDRALSGGEIVDFFRAPPPPLATDGAWHFVVMRDGRTFVDGREVPQSYGIETA